MWHFLPSTLPGWVSAPLWLKPISMAMELGWTGVTLFFVLSGFLIGGIILDKSPNTTTADFFKSFYTRRTLRIFPLYYLLFLGILVTIRIKGDLGDRNLTHASWWYATFLQNIAMARDNAFGGNWMAVTWSLAVEEQFYLFLPILLLFTPRKWTPVTLGIGAVLSIGVRWFFYSGGNNVTAAYVLTPCRSDALLLGVLGAWAVRQPNIVRWISTNQEKSTWVFMVLLFGVIASVLGSHNYNAKGMVLYGQTWFALLYSALLLLAVSFKTGAIATLMRFVPLRYLGRISYGVYLFHLVVKSWVLTFLVKNPNSWTAVLAATALTIGLATILHYLVEAPCVRIGHWICERRGKEKLAEKVSSTGELATILSAR